MVTFWIITFAMALIVSAVLVLVLIRGRAREDGAEPAVAYDLQVYRDQLRDVDRDLAREVIGKADAERVRVEISRRILAADAQVRQELTTAGELAGELGEPGALREPAGSVVGLPAGVTAVVMAGVIIVVLIAGSLGLYSLMGAPGYGDLGLEQRIEMAEKASKERPGQDVAEAQLPPSMPLDLNPGYANLIAQLRDTVAGRPGDLDGQRLLAQHEAKSGNFVAAHQAQAKVIALMGDTVGAEEFGIYTELLIAAAGGYVSPEAETAIRTTLMFDPRHGPSRYYWGMLQGQTGRPDLAFRVWERALRDGPPDAIWIGPIRAQIEEMAWLAGVEYTLPALARPSARPSVPPLAGPSAEDVEAASGMNAQDQQQMIRGMVERLSERLATEGGNPAEWSRLIGALAVLGETTRAQTIFDEAKGVFAGNDAALSEVTQAAQRAGLAL
jgi:cytochrome c-type biogenesis protein CcmH